MNRRPAGAEAAARLRAKSKTEGCRSVVEKRNAGNPEKLEVLFDEIVAFSTNLSRQELANEAFLRRIGRKLAVDCARPEECVEICRWECMRHGLAFRAEAVRHLTDVEHPARRMRRCACHPNDIPGRVAAICRYEERSRVMEAALICRAYHGHLAEL